MSLIAWSDVADGARAYAWPAPTSGATLGTWTAEGFAVLDHTETEAFTDRIYDSVSSGSSAGSSSAGSSSAGSSSAGGAIWEPYGEAGEAISPTGRACDTLPSSEWVMAWVTALGLRDGVYTLYDDDTYPLGAGGSAGLVGLLGSLPGVPDIPDPVGWSATPDSGATRAAVALLTSESSETVIRDLLAPLGIFTTRERVTLFESDEDDGSEDAATQLDVPLVNPLSTPLVRVLRRFLPPSEQARSFDERSETSAVDTITQDAFFLISAALRFEAGLPPDVDFEVPAPSFEPSVLGDRPYNPIVGTLLEEAPAWQGLWGRKGALGLATSLLMPQRVGPQVMGLPLNWAASNQAEFLGPIAFASSRYRELTGGDMGDALERILDISLPDELRSAIEAMSESNGELLVLPPDLLSDLREKIDELVEVPEDPMTGIGSAVRGTTIWPALGLLVIGQWAGALLVKIVGGKLGRALEAAEVGVGDMLDMYVETLDDALSPEAAPNDILASVFFAVRGALSWVEDVIEALDTDWVGALDADVEDALKDLEEGLVLGLDEQAFHALSLALAGRVYRRQLEDIAAGDPDLPPVYSFAFGTSEAAEAMLAQHDATTPVWMLDATYFAWDFDDFELYPWYSHQTEVDGMDLSAWVERISPVWQVIRAIDTAAGLLEAGLQAESTFLALSGLPTGLDSAGLMVREQLSLLGLGSIHQVIPDISLARFASALWRQAMIDRLLLDLDAARVPAASATTCGSESTAPAGPRSTGCATPSSYAGREDLACVYELLPWMDSLEKRELLDAMLGPLDADLGRRRYEEGWVGELGSYSDETGEWIYFDNLDAAWPNLSCDQHGPWRDALALLLQRDGLLAVQDLIDSTRSDGSSPDVPDILDESDMIAPLSEVGEIPFTDTEVFAHWVEDALVGSGFESLGIDLDIIIVGPTFPAEDLATVWASEFVAASSLETITGAWYR